MTPISLRSAIVAAVCLVCAPSAMATWSICAADTDTGELAIGTVTCLENFDIMTIVPVVVVAKGVGAAQAFADDEGTRRPVIFEGLASGVPPAEILEMLAEIRGHEFRQYGIVDTSGGAVTFRGLFNVGWAGGMTGLCGSITYAIQGNVLAGACVLSSIETALCGVEGDLPDRLMAGMEAARAAGGDGRCSCSFGDPDGCGCPPGGFDKAGHIGAMVVARIGDTDDPACDAGGCADGDYVMRLNVAFQDSGDDDPVEQLHTAFLSWRDDHTGTPDAVHSLVTFDPPVIPPNGVARTFLEIEVLDWRDQPIDVPLSSIAVEHGPGSAGLSSIGAVIDRGGGVLSVPLTAGAMTGVDRFRIVVDDGDRPVTLMPDPALEYFRLGDIDGSGVVNTADIIALLTSWGPCAGPLAPCVADLDGDGVVAFGDVLIMLGNWGR